MTWFLCWSRGTNGCCTGSWRTFWVGNLWLFCHYLSTLKVTMNKKIQFFCLTSCSWLFLGITATRRELQYKSSIYSEDEGWEEWGCLNGSKIRVKGSEHPDLWQLGGRGAGFIGMANTIGIWGLGRPWALTSLSVTKSHVDHTLVTSWREFTPPLEDEVFISLLSLSWDRSAMGSFRTRTKGEPCDCWTLLWGWRSRLALLGFDILGMIRGVER